MQICKFILIFNLFHILKAYRGVESTDELITHCGWLIFCRLQEGNRWIRIEQRGGGLLTKLVFVD